MRRGAVVLVAAIALAGCGGDDGGGTKTVTVNEPAATEDATASATATAAEETPTAAPAGSEDAIAAQTVQARGANSGTVDIAIAELAVRGELMTLSVTFTPHIEELSSEETIDVYAMHGDISPFVTLVDPVNLKRYVVVFDSESDPVSSLPEDAETVNEEPVDMQFTFAAPPEDVEQVDVMVGDWPPFRDVAITR